MTTPTDAPRDLDRRTLGAIAADSPAAIQVLEEMGLDYCCAGERTLAEAAQEAGVPVERVAARIGERDEPGDASPPAATDALIRHITEQYHRRHRQDLPELVRLAGKVETVHAFDADTPHGLKVLLERLQSKLIADMDEEEQSLFPAALRGDRSAAARVIAGLRARKALYGRDIHAIEETANGFDLPPGACPSWQRLYFGTARLVDELRHHVHLEHNVLFPRMLGGHPG